MPIYERKQKVKRIKKDVKEVVKDFLNIVPEGNGHDGTSSPGSTSPGRF